MKNHYLSFKKLFWAHFYGGLSNLILKKRAYNLPTKIGDYKLKKPFIKIGTTAPFSLALYQNHHGKKAIAKIWHNQVKDFNYHTLQNEIAMYQIIGKLKKRFSHSLPKRFENIHVPTLVKNVENANSLIALIEFVPGEVAKNLTAKKKFQVYLITIEFIKFLGDQMTQEEKNLIAKRNMAHYVLLYPLLLSKAIITHPRTALLLLRGVPIFIRCIPTLSKQQTTLVHRDLHFRNILVSKTRINLIDLQFCAFTHPMYEMITTLRYRWEDKEFRNYLLSYIRNKYSNNPNSEKLFKGLSVNSLTHGLTGRFDKSKIDSWIEFLRFVLKPAPILNK